MITLEIKKGNLFDHINDQDIFTHAVNALGVWGGGIARDFYGKFPKAYLQYRNRPKERGDGFIVFDNSGDICVSIGCLVTSYGFGLKKDPPDMIVKSTYKAVKNLLEGISAKELTIHSPKLNAGLFNVPWERTWEMIIKAGNESNINIKWVVWEL